MFGIGMPEMLLILVVALMVFGPRRLPELAETIGRAVARLRAATGAVQSQVEREMRAVREAAPTTTSAPETPAEGAEPATRPDDPAHPSPPADDAADTPAETRQDRPTP